MSAERKIINVPMEQITKFGYRLAFMCECKLNNFDFANVKQEIDLYPAICGCGKLDFDCECGRKYQFIIHSRTELYTIGNGNRSFNQLLSILKEAKIDAIIDVRAIRKSWSGSYVEDVLGNNLAEHGIEYYWCEGLGNPPSQFLELEKLRQIQKYGRDIKNGVYDMLIESICEFMKDNPNKRFCLFCAEKHAIVSKRINCHRVYIAERIKKLMKNVSIDLIHL